MTFFFKKKLSAVLLLQLRLCYSCSTVNIQRVSFSDLKKNENSTVKFCPFSPKLTINKKQKPSLNSLFTSGSRKLISATPSVGPESEDLAEPGGGAGVDEERASVSVEVFPVSAADGGKTVDWNEAFVTLPPGSPTDAELQGAEATHSGRTSEGIQTGSRNL